MNTNLTIRVDDNVKKQSQAILSNLGMDLSSAINIFLRQVILKEGIPFVIDSSTVNKETYDAMAEAYKGVGLSEGFDSAESLIKDLDAKTSKVL